MRKFSILFLFIINISSNKLISQDQYISVGVKLGYNLGKDGGFVYGVEVSFVDWRKSLIGGVLGGVFDLDIYKNDIIIHVGLQETLRPYFGYDIGPSIYFSNNKVHFGGSLNIFGGMFIFPFYGYSYFPTEKISINQLGTYLKYPINIKNLY